MCHDIAGAVNRRPQCRRPELNARSVLVGIRTEFSPSTSAFIVSVIKKEFVEEEVRSPRILLRIFFLRTKDVRNVSVALSGSRTEI